MNRAFIFMSLVGLFATSLEAKDKRVYLLKEPGSFVDIKKSVDKPVDSSAEFVMRDPNLGGDPKPTLPTKRKIVRIAPKKVAKPQPSAVSFKPLRVAGSVRMPRVEFGRVSLPVGIREESPSINFSDRDLLDAP